jgi:ParB/RepB/Spo0J family partition protein
LLVRPHTENGFEIVAGARRYRAAQMAEAATVPVRIVNLNDAEALEAQLVENLIRADVHPMEEAQGFKALLDLEEPTYSIEQIAAKTGKSPAFVAARLKLVDLVPVAVEAFYRAEIGVGHALLLAKLPANQQEQVLSVCFREDWSGSSDRKAKRILLPVRSLQFWIEQNVLLFLKDAPFDKRDAHLVAIAGNCVDCPKRTGHNKLLFSDLGKQDACTDRSNGANALREAAAAYKVDTDAIAIKVKHEFAAKEKAKRRLNQYPKVGPRIAKQPRYFFRGAARPPEMSSITDRLRAGRQDDVPPSCTFPLYCLRRFGDEERGVRNLGNR